MLQLKPNTTKGNPTTHNDSVRKLNKHQIELGRLRTKIRNNFIRSLSGIRSRSRQDKDS